MGEAAIAAVVPDQSYWSTLTPKDIVRITKNLSENFGSKELITLREKIPVIGDDITKKANECATLGDTLHDAADDKTPKSSEDMGPLFTATMKKLLGPLIYEECLIREETKSDADPFFREAGRTNATHKRNQKIDELTFSINMPRFGLGFESILTLFSLEKAVQGTKRSDTMMTGEVDVVESASPGYLVYVTVDNIAARRKKNVHPDTHRGRGGLQVTMPPGILTGGIGSVHAVHDENRLKIVISPSHFFDQAGRTPEDDCYEKVQNWWELNVQGASVRQGIFPLIVINLKDVGITVLEGSTLAISLNPASRQISYTIIIGGEPSYVLTYTVDRNGRITCISPPTDGTPDATGASLARNLNVGKRTGNEWFKQNEGKSSDTGFVYKGLIYAVCKLLGDDLAVLCNPNNVAVSTNDRGILIRATINGVYILYYYSTVDGVMIFRLVQPKCREKIRLWRSYESQTAHQVQGPVPPLVSQYQVPPPPPSPPPPPPPPSPLPLTISKGPVRLVLPHVPVRATPYPTTTTRFGRDVRPPYKYDGTLPQSLLSSRGGNGKFTPELITLLQFFSAKLTCFIGVLKDRIDSLNKVLEVLNEIQSKDGMVLVVECITFLKSFITKLFDFLTSVMKREDDLDFEDDVALQTRLYALLKFLLGKNKLTDDESVSGSAGSVSLDTTGNVNIYAIIKKVDEILTQCTITLPVYEITPERGFVVKIDFGLLGTLENIVRYFNGVDVFESVANADADKRDLVDILRDFKVIYAPLIVDEGAVSAVEQHEQSHYQQKVYFKLIELLKNYFKNKSLFEKELTELEKNILKEHAANLPHIHDYGYTFYKFAILNVYLVTKLVSIINETLLQQGYFSLDLEESIIKALCSNESEAEVVWSLFQKEFRYNGSYIARIAVIRAFISKVEFTGNRVAYAGNIDELLQINSHIDDKLLLEMEFARVSLGEVIDDISKRRDDSVIDATSKDAVIREINSLIKRHKSGPSIMRTGRSVLSSSSSGLKSDTVRSDEKDFRTEVPVGVGGKSKKGKRHDTNTRKKNNKSTYVAKRRIMYKKFVRKYIIKADKRGEGAKGAKRRGGANVTRRKIKGRGRARSRVSKNNTTRKNPKKNPKKKNTNPNLRYNLHKRSKTLKR